MNEQNELDESDRRLAEALQGGIAQGTYEVGMDGSSSDGQDDFMSALNAYRAIKKTGDAKAIRAAERHLQEVTRAELRANETCE